MQEQMSSHAKELICINVEKVYDWVVKDLSFEFSPASPISFLVYQLLLQLQVQPLNVM